MTAKHEPQPVQQSPGQKALNRSTEDAVEQKGVISRQALAYEASQAPNRRSRRASARQSSQTRRENTLRRVVDAVAEMVAEGLPERAFTRDKVAERAQVHPVTMSRAGLRAKGLRAELLDVMRLHAQVARGGGDEFDVGGAWGSVSRSIFAEACQRAALQAAESAADDLAAGRPLAWARVIEVEQLGVTAQQVACYAGAASLGGTTSGGTSEAEDSGADRRTRSDRPAPRSWVKEWSKHLRRDRRLETAVRLIWLEERRWLSANWLTFAEGMTGSAEPIDALSWRWIRAAGRRSSIGSGSRSPNFVCASAVTQSGDERADGAERDLHEALDAAAQLWPDLVGVGHQVALDEQLELLVRPSALDEAYMRAVGMAWRARGALSVGNLEGARADLLAMAKALWASDHRPVAMRGPEPLVWADVAELAATEYKLLASVVAEAGQAAWVGETDEEGPFQAFVAELLPVDASGATVEGRTLQMWRAWAHRDWERLAVTAFPDRADPRAPLNWSGLDDVLVLAVRAQQRCGDAELAAMLVEQARLIAGRPGLVFHPPGVRTALQRLAVARTRRRQPYSWEDAAAALVRLRAAVLLGAPIPADVAQAIQRLAEQLPVPAESSWTA